MRTPALRQRSTGERFVGIAARLEEKEPRVPPALGFLFACAGSLAAWVMILGLAYVLVGKLG
jgi:hypothetical protein